MANRLISTSFWNDTWIQDLDADEKLLYIYLLTSPLTNIAGIYEIGIRRICFDSGLSTEKAERALKKFEDAGKISFYENWIILINWPKYQNVSEQSNVRKGIDRVLEELPDKVFKKVVEADYKYEYLSELQRFKDYKVKKEALSTSPLQAPYKPLISPLQEPSNTILNYTIPYLTITKDIYSPASQDDVSSFELLDEGSKITRGSEKKGLHNDEPKAKSDPIPYQEIIGYLNKVCGTGFKHTAKSHRRHIRSRWNEGYRLTDFRIVVDKKAEEWLNSEQAKYLRPSTIFGSKFDDYLNQLDSKPKISKNKEEGLRELFESLDDEEEKKEDDE